MKRFSYSKEEWEEITKKIREGQTPLEPIKLLGKNKMVIETPTANFLSNLFSKEEMKKFYMELGEAYQQNLKKYSGKQTYFRHFRFQEGNRQRGTVYGLLEGEIFKFSVSVCSKHDTFCKKLGRERAMKRMELYPTLTLRYKREFDKVSAGKYFVHVADALMDLFSESQHSLIPIQ